MEQATAAGRNMYYEGQHGAEEPADTIDRLALVKERDTLKATLLCIVEADWRTWGELADADEFVLWAKSRASHALAGGEVVPNAALTGCGPES